MSFLVYGLRRQTMQKGTVKWFNPTKGYGFIKPSSGDKDVFVHISAVERAGLRTLNEGQAVEYELVTNLGGKLESCVNQRPVCPASRSPRSHTGGFLFAAVFICPSFICPSFI